MKKIKKSQIKFSKFLHNKIQITVNKKQKTFNKNHKNKYNNKIRQINKIK